MIDINGVTWIYIRSGSEDTLNPDKVYGAGGSLRKYS